MSKRRRQREPVEVTLHGLSHEGRGVGRIDGKTVFVHGALPDETVRARILRRRGQFDEAEMLEVLRASADRIEPRCAHFGTCGGCALQHLDETRQLAHKQSVLLELLQHHAGCAPERVAAPLRGPQWGYRRKARLGVKNVPAKGGVIAGFRERAKAYITDCSHCDILDPRLGTQLPALREMLQTLTIAARIPQIEVAFGDSTAALIVRHLEPLSVADRERLAAFAGEHDFDIFLQSGGPATVTPLDSNTRMPAYRLDDFEFTFAPGDFTQVNATINTAMVARALAYLEPANTDVVADLFCGIGNFSLPIARRVARVLGVEGEAGLVRRAGANAVANGVNNCDFRTLDLADAAALATLDLTDCNKLLLDPPRAGADVLLSALDLASVSRLVYVSCNPLTFARDTAILRERHGYTLSECGVLDMFPQTAHFESIALFERR